MNTASMEEKFSEIVEKNSDSIYESCKKCVDLLEGWGREAQEGFQYFLTQVPLPQYAPGEVPKGFIQIREEEVDVPTQKRIREMEFQIVKELILQDVTEKKFYQELWKRFCDTLLISDRYQRAYFLLRTWLDPRIPYYRLGLGPRMDDETFQACVQQVEPPFKKTRLSAENTEGVHSHGDRRRHPRSKAAGRLLGPYTGKTGKRNRGSEAAGKGAQGLPRAYGPGRSVSAVEGDRRVKRELASFRRPRTTEGSEALVQNLADLCFLPVWPGP